MAREKYKILQVREKDFNTFNNLYETFKELHPNLTKTEFFQLIINYYKFHNEDKIINEIKQLRGVL